MRASTGLHGWGIALRRGGRIAARLDRLEVRPGEALALMGPNGSGKSTLLRGIAGLLPLSAGRVCFDGRDLAGLSASRRAAVTACLLQRHRVAFDFTVAELVALGLSRPSPGRVSEALRRVGLQALEDRRWSRCSGGEQQRAHLARALVGGRPLLLLDEPDNHLDLGATALLRRLLDEERARGVTVVLATHSVELAADCSAVLLLADGRPRLLGPPGDVFRDPVFFATFGIATPPGNPAWHQPSARGLNPRSPS